MQQGEEVVYLYLDDIIPNRFQPREIFDERSLKELAVSIKEHGVIQPIIVRKVNDKYEIIAGERRYKASALAGLTKIPAIIRNLDDKETSKVALLENLQRKNLNPLEEAKTYQKILEIDEMTQEELAKTMGKSQSAVSNKLRLLSLPEEIQEALLKEKISERHARALLNVENKEEQKELLKEIIDKKMTVRQLESKIKGEPEQKLEENELSIPENSEDIGSSANFLNNSPLIPNFDGILNSEPENKEPLITVPIQSNNDNSSNEKDESGSETMSTNEPLIVIPNDTNDKSSSNLDSENNRFINFGEIDDDDDEDSEDEKFYEGTVSNQGISFGTGPTSADTAIDLDNLKQNTKDINVVEDNKPSADLDSLLRINDKPFSVSEKEGEENDFKFFSPAAEAIKNSEKEEDIKNSEDYFRAPDLINIDLPGAEPTFNTNNVPLSTDENIKIVENNSQNSIEEAIKIIQSAINKIEQSGIKVEKDEMNMTNSYQVIIKLNKNN